MYKPVRAAGLVGEAGAAGTGGGGSLVSGCVLGANEDTGVWTSAAFETRAGGWGEGAAIVGVRVGGSEVRVG